MLMSCLSSFFFSSSFNCFFCWFVCSGAFSNVYKALDRRTGFKTAVKVVRKYELNASQVSKPLLFTLLSVFPFSPFRPGLRSR